MNEFIKLDPETKVVIIKLSCVTVLVSSTSYLLYNVYKNHQNKLLIKKKQLELLGKKTAMLTKLKNLKTPFENMDKITSLSLQELITAISSKTYKPIDILQAYQAKALMMDKEYNFITDLNLNAYSDLAVSENVKDSPLKCIPVSIKDCFKVAGCDCTFGMLDLALTPATEDEVMIQAMRLLGMVPFVITNVPQSCHAIFCSNPIYGETLNPYNKKRSSGGSSGGEGAILASGASIVGWGSDIAASIRIPCTHCGLFGLKPTALKFSLRHALDFYPGQNLVNNSFGPMARRFDDLLIFYKALTSEGLYDLDPYSAPVGFNDKLYESKQPLRIGYYTNIGGTQVQVIPAVARAVEMAKTALEANGHKLIPFSIPDIDYAFHELFVKCVFADGGSFLKHFFKDNPVDHSVMHLSRMIRMPKVLKRLYSLLLLPFNRNHSQTVLSTIARSSVYELWELRNRLNNYKELVLTNLENEKLDAIMCPVQPICAPPLGIEHESSALIVYTAIYNLLDYPSGVVPVTKVNKADMDKLNQSYPRDTRVHRRIIEYQKDSIGMPIGVQCVAKPWKEEICLRLMREISEKLVK